MSRFRLLTAVSMALAALAVLAPASPAVSAAGKPAPVRITLSPDYSGRVISDKSSCFKQRTVYLLGHTGSGDVTGYGSLQSDNQGRYRLLTMRAERSDLFALTIRELGCQVAQSRSVGAPDARAGQLTSRDITLQVTPSRLQGRVTSAKPGCVRGVDVVLFGQLGTDPYSPAIATRTNRHGRYHYNIGGPRGLRGETAHVFAVALGDDACGVAQSPTRTISPST